MKKVLLPLFFLALLVSCKEDEEIPVDPCSNYNEIEFTFINDTVVDVNMLSVVFGCQGEVNPSGEIVDHLDVKAGKTGEYITGWWGASSFLVNLFVNSTVEDTVTGEIKEENQKVILLITFDGTNYNMELI